MLNPGAGKTKQAYLFAYRSADPHAPAITVFDFCTRRSGKHARRFLGDWQRALMVDDFAGYKAGFVQGITELACLAHIRRKFFELHERQASTLTGPPLASIAQLYRIEADARGLDPPARQTLRQTHAKPILDAWWAWILTVRPTVVGGSGIAKALDYTIKRWPVLLRYLDDGRYPIDNNPVENAIWGKRIGFLPVRRPPVNVVHVLTVRFRPVATTELEPAHYAREAAAKGRFE